MSPSDVVFAVLVAVLVLIVLLGWSKTQHDRHTRALAVARELGLSVRGNDEIVGTFEGVEVAQYARDYGGSSRTDWWTLTRADLLESLPPGLRVARQGALQDLAELVGGVDLQLGNELDPELRIRASDASAARALLTDPAVVAALATILARPEAQIDLRGHELDVRVRGHHLDQSSRCIREVTALVRALAVAAREPWVRLARAHQLSTDRDLTTLEGTIDGIALTVSFFDVGGTRIDAPLRHVLPGDTVVVGRGGPGGQRLGDPVLDSLISVRTPDLPALRARLCRDEVRGSLLAVVHGFPGSMIDPDGVHLVGPGRLHDRLDEAISAVVELARALDAAA